MIIRPPMQFAVNHMAEQVREAFQFTGEEFIFANTYHAFVDDADTEAPGPFPRCPRCWDDDYQQSTDLNCPVCLGTGIAPNDTSGGIKHFGRVFGVVSDNRNNKELLRKYGEFDQDDREIQIEAINPEPQEHDYIIRVMQWSVNHCPLVLGPRYRIDNPTPQSLRTGNQFGQALNNIVGYTFRAQLLRDFHPVHNFSFPPTTPVPRY